MLLEETVLRIKDSRHNQEEVVVREPTATSWGKISHPWGWIEKVSRREGSNSASRTFKRLISTD
jgi:hypothetical protein